MRNEVDFLKQSSSDELVREFKKRRLRAGVYAGAAIGGGLVASKTHGLVEAGSIAEAAGTGFAAWKNWSQMLLSGGHGIEKMDREIEYLEQLDAKDQDQDPESPEE